MAETTTAAAVAARPAAQTSMNTRLLARWTLVAPARVDCSANTSAERLRSAARNSWSTGAASASSAANSSANRRVFDRLVGVHDQVRISSSCWSPASTSAAHGVNRRRTRGETLSAPAPGASGSPPCRSPRRGPFARRRRRRNIARRARRRAARQATPGRRAPRRPSRRGSAGRADSPAVLRSSRAMRSRSTAGRPSPVSSRSCRSARRKWSATWRRAIPQSQARGEPRDASNWSSGTGGGKKRFLHHVGHFGPRWADQPGHQSPHRPRHVRRTAHAKPPAFLTAIWSGDFRLRLGCPWAHCYERFALRGRNESHKMEEKRFQAFCTANRLGTTDYTDTHAVEHVIHDICVIRGQNSAPRHRTVLDDWPAKRFPGLPRGPGFRGRSYLPARNRLCNQVGR